MTPNVSRRSLLALGAGFGASAMLGETALAKAPKLGTQPAYFYRFGLGDAEVTVVSDGPLPLGPPKGTFIGVPDDEVKKMLTDNFLSAENVVLEQNSPIVNTGDKLILFDTGMGTAKNFGPTTGRQQKSMKEAGIKPEDIDAVVFRMLISTTSAAWWTRTARCCFPTRSITSRRPISISGPIRQGERRAEGLRRARPQEPAAGARPHRVLQGRPGVPARRAGIAAPGHTVGHTIFTVTSNGKSFCFLGDLSHHPILLLEKPRMQFSYDTDPAQAAETRVKLLDRLAADKIRSWPITMRGPASATSPRPAEGYPLLSGSDEPQYLKTAAIAPLRQARSAPCSPGRGGG